tara:strand:- start:51 stop:479 length:429 start_codon:yes stop_codon:yes gene_type:complete
MKKARIKFLQQLPAEEGKGNYAILYPFLVTLDNGDEIIVKKASQTALQVGNYLEYKYKDKNRQYQGRSFRTAYDVGYKEKTYDKKTTSTFSTNDQATFKDKYICRQSQLTNAIRIHSNKPHSTLQDILNTARELIKFVNQEN